MPEKDGPNQCVDRGRTLELQRKTGANRSNRLHCDKSTRIFGLPKIDGGIKGLEVLVEADEQGFLELKAAEFNVRAKQD